MFKVQGNVVLRFCGALDEFIKLRVFGAEEAFKLLRGVKLTNRRSFQNFVLSACVVEYHDQIFPKISRFDPDRKEKVEQELYGLSVELNPGLNIETIAIPVLSAPESQTQLHLLEQSSQSTRNLAWVNSLEEELSRRVIGQQEAVELVARGIRKSVAGIRDQRKPVGSFFFVGSTGVGKTELAKALTEAMYRDMNRLVRLDCSEYAMPHEYAKLIGAPPGYIGHDQGGVLTEAMKRHDGVVVLFDEIEKADNKVHNLLLQILDEGFLADSKGQRVPFNNAVIILTSNVGVEKIESLRRRVGFDRKDREEVAHESRRDLTLDALKEAFRPEFLNRIDEVVTFRPLTRDDCRQILHVMLEEVAGYALKSNLRLRFTPDVEDLLCDLGYSPEYGARELRRFVKRRIESPLSEEIINGRIRPGDRVQVELQRDEIVFRAN